MGYVSRLPSCQKSYMAHIYNNTQILVTCNTGEEALHMTEAVGRKHVLLLIHWFRWSLHYVMTTLQTQQHYKFMTSLQL